MKPQQILILKEEKEEDKVMMMKMIQDNKEVKEFNVLNNENHNRNIIHFQLYIISKIKFFINI